MDALPGTGGTVDGASGGTAPASSGGSVGSGSGNSGGQAESGGSGGTLGSGGAVETGGTGGETAAGGSGAGGTGAGGTSSEECVDSGAAETFSFFLTSYHHIVELSGSDDGFGGDLRWNGAATGLEGADAICQEMARRVCHGDKTWKAYLSTSEEDAIDRIGAGPWYDYAGELVAENTAGLTAGDRPAGGCCDDGTYDELGTFHDGSSDVNDDGIDDDDHDTLTSTKTDGTYSGFSCDDWTSTTTAAPESGGGGPGSGDSTFVLGHSWPAQSGQSWVAAHSARGCQAGTNFIQNGGGMGGVTVGAAGGYGAFYCFAADAP
jgi:hypothetical protein